MAFLSSRFIGVVPVTIVESESHVSKLDVTKLPVESGADITDHAYIQPKEVTVKIWIGGTGRNIFGQFTAAAGYQALVSFQQARIPFFYISSLTVYKDMLISEISAPVTVDNGNALEATIKLQQVLLVGSGFFASVLGAIAGGQAFAMAAATLSAGPTSKKASPPVKRGDNVVRTASLDQTTNEGRKNQRVLTDIGV